MTRRFDGRRALVTGSSRGIGAGVAERLAAEGADVALVARTLGTHATLPGSLEETAARIAKYGTKVEIVVADLTDEQQRDTVVPLAIEKLGGTIDILVNNAAAAIYQPLSDYPLRRRRLMFEANVHAPLDLMQAVVPGMVANGHGWIVNVSSGTVKPWHGPPFTWVEPGTAMTVYGASKAALNRMSNGMGVELYGQGVRVNTVQPRAAVLSEGARVLVGETIRPDQVESMEEMVEAVTALCDCDTEFTARSSVSLDLIDEWSLTVRGLDGAALPENPALRTEELA
ncbi:SDR family NAD(P)-dependent oxidoreductase [Rhodococcus qingshengii]|uniref:SDR family NAD(P)-dependent oxidoreductase n=1 Tax=Rhodococcus qingshengii TaxID=334542 RepID=UPI001AE148F7|nr:SDR family NAD(P)-dependent oxidoreductase [Rhodococcus qingshengii]MBP1050855.1 SDR family NAD(P)-dependent oxidoreductase [Rhodococcus qingshengii]